MPPPPTYMTTMRTLFVVVPLLALLAFSVWFAAVAWERLGGDAIPAATWPSPAACWSRFWLEAA